MDDGCERVTTLPYHTYIQPGPDELRCGYSIKKDVNITYDHLKVFNFIKFQERGINGIINIHSTRIHKGVVCLLERCGDILFYSTFSQGVFPDSLWDTRLLFMLPLQCAQDGPRPIWRRLSPRLPFDFRVSGSDANMVCYLFADLPFDTTVGLSLDVDQRTRPVVADNPCGLCCQ